MARRRYSIAPEIFESFPHYSCGVVFVDNVSNFDPVGAAIARLRVEEGAFRSRLEGQDLATSPNIASWRNAYRAFGTKPSEYRSAIEAIGRRVMRGDSLPSINPLVDIGNAFSLRHVVPIGAHSIDGLGDEIVLRLSSGSEVFTPLGSDQYEHPFPGEVILADGETVLTRRWTWRQGAHSMVEHDTRTAIYNVDGLPPVSTATVQDICSELVTAIWDYCHCRGQCHLLNSCNLSIRLDVPKS